MILNKATVLLILSCLFVLPRIRAAPLEHLIQGLPGQPLVGFRQFSGYLTVDEKLGTNLFYYFVEAESNASNLPITLWLNGGPGCSSIGGGAFTELGPFYPNPTANRLRRNLYSWNRVSNLLFLESPAGVGWSYSEKPHGYKYNDRRVANESLIFLKKWFEIFSEYKRNKLLLTGESYAGHYIPQLASLILEQNGFNLEGIMIGNPLLNYGIDTSATYSFLWSHGLISDKTFKGVSKTCDFRYGYMGGDQEDEQGVQKKKKRNCTNFLGSAREEIGRFINMYDVTINVCHPPIVRQEIFLQKLMGLTSEEEKIDVCIDHEITHYLNQQSVQKALHANRTFLPYPWEACSRIVDYNSSDQLSDILPLLSSLIKQRLRVWIYSGDQDSVVPLTGTRSQVAELAERLKLKTRVKYRAWNSFGQVGGWYESYEGGLVYATVRGASHMVPYVQPERALVLFSNFLSNKPLPALP